ncbi:RNA-binding RNA annealing protein [Microbotryomycetes sp. JL221]|nr:RNA-binding RNA annealing protein [Microbotryomycetes sp. JL221]
MAVDQSLDDIISSKKQTRKPAQQNRRPAGAPARGQPKQPAAAQTNDLSAAAASQGIVPPSLGGVIGNQIILSGLPSDVTDQQIRELFTETVGPIFSVALVYDARGQFRNQAFVGFRRPADTTKAYQQYHGRIMDNKNKIRVEVVFNPDVAKPPKLAARLNAAPANAPVSSVVAAAGGQARQARTGPKPATRGAKQPRKPRATLESLDAEMADYQAQAQANGGAAATAPAA